MAPNERFESPNKLIVEVIYCKNYLLSKLNGDITDKLCSAINTIAPNSAVGAQKMKNVWVIGLCQVEAKASLLQIGHVIVDDMVVSLHSENPYTQISDNMERVVFKDLPIWESNDLLAAYIKQNDQLKTSSDDIYFSKARNSKNGPSNFYNGDRYIFASSGFDPPLPEKIKIGEYLVRIWYASRSMKCLRCRQTTHRTEDVSKCANYVPTDPDITPFTRGILCNFERIELHMDGMTFKTAEHAYQWHACTESMRPDLAEKVYNAASPHQAKKIASVLKQPDSSWHNIKYDVMRKVLIAKMKCSKHFRDELLQSGTNTLVEAREDSFWGSGLPYNITLTTDHRKYPGKNKLGLLLGELRTILKNDHLMFDQNQPNPPSPDLSNAPETSTSGVDSTPVSPPPVPSITPKPRASRAVKKTTIRQRSSSLSKMDQKKDTPLIREFFTQQLKRRRVKSSDTDAGNESDASATDIDCSSVSSVTSFHSTHQNNTAVAEGFRDVDDNR